MEKQLLDKKYSLLHKIQTEQDLLFLKKENQIMDSNRSGQTIPPDAIENLCKEFQPDNLLETEVDKFTKEMKISTFRSRAFSFPYKHPIDLLYISKPEGERFYVLYTGINRMYTTGSIIFNINENLNIILQPNCNDEFLGKTFEEFILEDYHKNKKLEYRSYVPITKEDFLKCSYAEHLSVRVRLDSSSIEYESECDELIPFFQMLFNKTVDDTLFADKKEDWEQTIKEILNNKYNKQGNIQYKKVNSKKIACIIIIMVLAFWSFLIFVVPRL